MNTDLKIKAQPQADSNKCDFSLEQPIEKFGAFRFDKSSEAKGSALAEEIFLVSGIVGILVLGSTITVTKNSDLPWTTLGKDIGQAIRKAYASGQALIAESRKQRSPDEQTLIRKIMDLIVTRINPAIASHSGFIELIDVKNQDIFIKMGGGCQGCASSAATLKQGVEQTFREEIPTLGAIYDTTDHSAGTNPYFS